MDIASAMDALTAPSQGPEEGEMVMGMAAAIPSPRSTVTASLVGEEVGPLLPILGAAEVLEATISPSWEVAWIEEVLRPSGVDGAPMTVLSQALVQLGGGSFLWGGSSPSSAYQDDLGLEVFKLDEVAKREEWSRIRGYTQSFSGSCMGDDHRVTNLFRLPGWVLALLSPVYPFPVLFLTGA